MTRDANLEFFGDYYDKPTWWWALRYDTQIKRKTCLALLRAAGVPRRGIAVLEIGFGSGATLFSFGRDCVLTGVELSASAVERARTRAARGRWTATFHAEVGGPLPVPDGSQDAVIASHVLEHVADEVGLLHEIRRVLKPGGRAVVLVPINERYADPKHLRAYTSASLGQAAAAAGLTVVHQLDNERLFRMMEWFYFDGGHARLGHLAPLIVAAFNIPTALLPWPVHRTLDALLGAAGWPARQTAALLAHREAV
jgi:ubiquinone/menaquinone biosynthesis C-methylase UbiE